MTYLVKLALRAAIDLETLYLEKNASESTAAASWYNGLERAVAGLSAHPDRCPAASEARAAKRKLRNLLYGKKPHVYRVIYEVDEARQTIWVLTVRHGARRKLRASDVPKV
ncbi:MAG: type II toxin-antitoxin system RelE/ParE family toxin [Candidatus Acidiferrum sp.]|jgi:toxin ParE1/3/4